MKGSPLWSLKNIGGLDVEGDNHNEMTFILEKELVNLPLFSKFGFNLSSFHWKKGGL
jgi:hypothetical protein